MEPHNHDLSNILIVDDDRKLCRLIADYLAPMGYAIDMAHTGDQGLDMALTGNFDAMILDVMMPGMDGFEVLKALRRQSNLPVLMLTARGDETDRIVGLEMGADDYLPKTFSSRELLARLRAVTRRSRIEPVAAQPENAADAPLTIGNVSILQAARSARLDGKPLELTPIEFDLLNALMQAVGRVLSRDQLLDAAAGRSYEVFDRSIDIHISSLRRKLKDNPRQPRFIKTVRSAGYMFLPADTSPS